MKGCQQKTGALIFFLTITQTVAEISLSLQNIFSQKLRDASAFSTSIKQRMTSPKKSFNPSCITLLSKHIAKNLPVVPLPVSADSILYNLDAISCTSFFKCRINTVTWESGGFSPPLVRMLVTIIESFLICYLA